MVWIVLFFVFFLVLLWVVSGNWKQIKHYLVTIFLSQFQGRTGWKRAWFVVFLVLFVVWIIFFLVLFLWYELSFFCGMNCCFFCVFFWYELCFFLWYELCFFCVLFCAFFCGRERRKSTKKSTKKKNTKKARKKHNKNQHFFGKNESQASCLRQPSDQRHSKCLTPCPFSNLLSKNNSQEWAHARSGNVKTCNYHMMFIKNLNNYCWRHAFVTLFTYNLQWLDRLIAVSRYLRYAAFNIVKNVMSHSIVSPYRCNTLHHHTISLPLLFDTQIFK